jgi:lipopolysaccharide cholinephosphotransferase
VKSNNNLQKAQEIMLSLLEEFDRICQKHHLTYWLDFGTLLGAVRHKGFIPWDDDLDVSMPYDDYKKFLQIATDELPESMFLQTKKTDPYAKNFFAKIRDRGSTCIDTWEANRVIRYHQGIFIDIFPAMRVSGATMNNRVFRFLILFSKWTHNRFVQIDWITKLLIPVINRFGDPCGEYLISAAETMHYLKPVKASNIFPLKAIEFEGKQFWTPGQADVYLKAFFGKDFMTLPPEDQRMVHNIQIEPQQPCAWEATHG